MFLVFSRFSRLKVAQRLLSLTKNKQIEAYSSDLSAFAIDILYTVSQRSKRKLAKIRSLAICKELRYLNRVNKKQLNILKKFLEYLEFYIAHWR